MPRPLQERTSCVCLHTCRRVACTSTLWSQARPGGGGAHSRRMHEARVHRRMPMPSDSRRSSSVAAHVRRRARESTLINIETDEDDGAARSCLRAASIAHILSQLHVRLSLCRPSAILSQRVGGRAVAAECGTERLCSRDREFARGRSRGQTGSTFSAPAHIRRLSNGADDDADSDGNLRGFVTDGSDRRRRCLL